MRNARKARLRAHRPVLSIGRDPNEDRAPIDLFKFVVTEPPFFECAGSEVLHDDVALRRKLPEEFTPPLAAEIQRHALLVARFGQPHQGIAAIGIGSEPPERVASLWRLDLDDFGAELAKDGGAVRPGDERTKIEDPDSRQRAHDTLRMRATRSRSLLASLTCIRSIMSPFLSFTAPLPSRAATSMASISSRAHAI